MGTFEVIASVFTSSCKSLAFSPPMNIPHFGQCRQALSCCQHINDSLNDPADIISITNDAMELKRVLSSVAPDGPAICVSCIFRQIVQTDPISPEQCQASAATAMSCNAPLCILHIHTGFCTKNRDQGSIN